MNWTGIEIVSLKCEVGGVMCKVWSESMLWIRKRNGCMKGKLRSVNKKTPENCAIIIVESVFHMIGFHCMTVYVHKCLPMHEHNLISHSAVSY